MDYWSCDSADKGFVADGMFSPNPESLARSKDEVLNWGMRAPCGYTQNSGGFGIQDLAKKQVVGGMNQIKVALFNKIGDGRGMTPIVENDGAFAEEEGASSSNFPIIDLKVGRISDGRNTNKSGSGLSQRASLPFLSSPELSKQPPKRGRAGGVNLHNAYCQVYGCHKDLSNCKDYHKRHKVCEVHSKTAKVIVNGIEQRFCQQCSRFHLLSEFDDGKRSCRKRLADHNQRRRKPQPGVHSMSSSRKMLLPHNGAKFSVNTCATASFICQEILPSCNPISSEKFGENGYILSTKAENKAELGTQSTVGFHHDQHFYSGMNFPSRSFNKQAFHHSKGFSAAVYQFEQQPNSDLLSLFQDETSLGSEDVSVFNSAAWTDQGLQRISKSTCAHSLLSSQSETCSSHTSGIFVDRSLVMHRSKSPCISRPSTENAMGSKLNQQILANGLSGEFRSLGMSSTEANLRNSILICSTGASNGIFPGPDLLQPKDHFSVANGATVDLLQLSSELQRMEHQRQSTESKNEADALFRLRTS